MLFSNVIHMFHIWYYITLLLTVWILALHCNTCWSLIQWCRYALYKVQAAYAPGVRKVHKFKYPIS